MFVVPIVAIGYMYLDRQRKQRGPSNEGSEDESANSNSNGDNNLGRIAHIKRFLELKQRGSSSSEGSEGGSPADSDRSSNGDSSLGPLANIKRFLEEQAQKLPPVWTDPCRREVHRQDESVVMFHVPLPSTEISRKS
jgi:hypothetical protein